MQVILLKDVAKVGKKGQICNVSDGYGRNFLIARGFAEVASEGRLRAVEKEKKEHEALLKREQEAAEAKCKILESRPLHLKVNAGAQDKLFGSITGIDIAAAIKEQFSEEVDKKNIKLDEPIRTLGEFNISVKLHSKVKAKIKLLVEKA